MPQHASDKDRRPRAAAPGTPVAASAPARPANLLRKVLAGAGAAGSAEVLALQRTLGNRAVLQLVRNGGLAAGVQRAGAHANGCGCGACSGVSEDRLMRAAVRTTGGAAGLIQRAPPAAFTALAAWPGGTAIPLGADGRWARPDWLRGQNHGAFTMRNALAANLVPVFAFQGQNFYRCGLCGKLGDLNGMGVDHRTDWRDSVQGSADRQEFERRYHDLDNLHLVHTNCNSSKSSRDLFDWWRANVVTHYMDVPAQQRVLAALDRVYATTGIDWLYEIPEDRRGAAASAVIEQAIAQNAFEYLMANSKLMSAVGGWKNTGPKDDGKDGDSAMT